MQRINELRRVSAHATESRGYNLEDSTTLAVFTESSCSESNNTIRLPRRSGTRRMKPFLIWAGGKRWLVGNYPGLLAAPSQRLVEPFLGSGAVFFHLQPSSALLATAMSSSLKPM